MRVAIEEFNGDYEIDDSGNVYAVYKKGEFRRHKV